MVKHRESIRKQWHLVQKVSMLSLQAELIYINVASALADDPTYIKALQRRAACNEQLGTWSSLTGAQDGMICIEKSCNYY